jgi:hypothetical protein
MKLAEAREKSVATAESVRQSREAKFREWDTNKDGLLELSEFHGHPGNFYAMDCDHDGTLSLEEFVNRYHCGEVSQAPQAETAVPRTVPRPLATATPLIGLRGSTLQEFRRLARDLDRAAFRMLEGGEAHASDYGDGGQFLLDLRTFSDEASDLYLRSTEVYVTADQIRPIVGHLLQDAHQTDKHMRQARVFPQLWDEWARTRGILNRMAQLLE